MNSNNTHNHTPDTWIDLTDMLVWRGHFTGIQRVTYEYARRFQRDGARFCAYDKDDDRFFEIDLAYIKDLQAEVKAGSTANTEPTVTLRRRIRQVVGKPYYMLDEKKKVVLRPLVGMVNFYVRYTLSHFQRHMDIDEPQSLHKDCSDADFKDGDMVILLGANWNDDSILEGLAREKKRKNLKIVQHINDLLPVYQPQLFSEDLPAKFRSYINTVIHHVDTITVISEATKRDVEAYCSENNIHNMRIEVVRLGDDMKVDKPLRPQVIKAQTRYILAVGTFEVRKNYALLYQVVKLAQLEGYELPYIVIAGRQGWLTDDLAHIIKLDPYAKERIIWIDNASDNEISWLYENCIFTVFPSLAEGWGLPMVESLQHGKMVLASGVSSMLEVGDGLVDYFLPYDARECLEKMKYHLAENRFIQANQKVAMSYKAYTWDESYKSLRVALEI